MVDGPFQFSSGTYNTVVLTAEDDDTLGSITWNSPGGGHPSGYYADSALEIPSASSTSLHNVRIRYTSTAIHYLGTTASGVTDTARHVQVLDCGTGFRTEGTAGYSRFLSLGNVLMSNVVTAVQGSPVFQQPRGTPHLGRLRHLGIRQPGLRQGLSP